VVSTSIFDLRKTDTLCHEISLKTKEPVYVKQLKIPNTHQQRVEKHVAEWLKLGVIKLTKSPLNSHIFAIAKKNGCI
jgi:hypothetical protein